MAAAVTSSIPVPSGFSVEPLMQHKKTDILTILTTWESDAWRYQHGAREGAIYADASRIINALVISLSDDWETETEATPGMKTFVVKDVARRVQAIAMVEFSPCFSHERESAIVLDLLVGNPANFSHPSIPVESQVRGAGTAIITYLKSLGKKVYVDPLEGAKKYYTRHGFSPSNVSAFIGNFLVWSPPSSLAVVTKSMEASCGIKSV